MRVVKNASGKGWHVRDGWEETEEQAIQARGTWRGQASAKHAARLMRWHREYAGMTRGQLEAQARGELEFAERVMDRTAGEDAQWLRARDALEGLREKWDILLHGRDDRGGRSLD